MPFEPVLRPAMQEMLTKEFDPPLPCEIMPNNAGRIIVRAKDLVQWLDIRVRATTHSFDTWCEKSLSGVVRVT